MIKELDQSINSRLLEELKVRNDKLFIPQLIGISFSIYFISDILSTNHFVFVPILLVLLSMLIRIKALGLNSQVGEILFYLGVSLTGLGWGQYFYLVEQHFGLFSLESIYSLLMIATLFGGAVTTLSASIRASFFFHTSLVIVPAYTLFSNPGPEHKLLGCLFLVSYFYHLHHSFLSHRSIRHMVSREVKELTHRNYLQEFVDVIPGFVAIIDARGNYELVNNYAAGIYRDLITTHVCMKALLKEFISEGKAQLVKEVCINVHGNSEWFMIHIRSAPSLGGMAIAILPITDLVKTRNELKIQEAKAHYSAKLASLGEVAAGIAHEVNNPLTIIEGAATIIDLNVSGSEMDLEVVQKMSKKIMHTTQRINKLVKSLKKLSRKDSFEPFEKVSLQSIIEPSLEIMQAKLKFNSIDLKVTSDFSEVFVEGREVELSQVVMNLISNAADAVENQDQRWIELKHHTNEDWCDILVTDSGRGVPLEIQYKNHGTIFHY